MIRTLQLAGGGSIIVDAKDGDVMIGQHCLSPVDAILLAREFAIGSATSRALTLAASIASEQRTRILAPITHAAEMFAHDSGIDQQEIEL